MRQLAHINRLEVSKKRCPKHSTKKIYLLVCNQTFCPSNNATFARPQGILILWRFTYGCSFQRFASDNDNTNCAEITRLSVLSCNVIDKKKTKAVTSQKLFCSSVSQTLIFGGEKRPPEIRLRSQAKYHFSHDI